MMKRFALAGMAAAIALACSACTDEYVASVSTSASTITVSPMGPVVANGVAKLTVRVTARDSNGLLLGGRAVVLSVTGSGNTLVQPVETTNSEGFTTGTLTSTVAEMKTISATISGEPVIQKVTVHFVPPLAPPSNLVYSANPVVYAVGVAIPANTATSGGGAVALYSVSPALPAGLALNTSTGDITGTPTLVAPAADYVITASNSAGSTTVEVSIAINATVVAPTSLAYSLNPAVYTLGTAIPPNTPTVGGGAVSSYSVTPALPGGLSLSTSTGIITGTPTALKTASIHTVTATNSAGSATALVSIAVVAVPPSGLAYSTPSAIYTQGTAIGANAPASSGGAVVSYSISPSLPPGLAFNTVTGVITGTPTALSNASNYTVTATNSGGSTSAMLSIEVRAAVGSAATGSMGSFRMVHTATLLDDGKVLVAGGFGTGVAQNTAELYDPATATWSGSGNMVEGRRMHGAVKLLNGKVLIVGGLGAGAALASAELYDPASNTFSATGSLGTARQVATVTLLPNGKVLVAGGQDGTTLHATAELYDPATGTWSPTGAMALARRWHTANLLADGKVLVIGGADQASDSRSTSAELYDPAAGTFSATGSLAAGRFGAASVLLDSGKVLVVGGDNNTLAAELYDPATGTFAATGALASSHFYAKATLLANGKVLVAGGLTAAQDAAVANVEIYDPGTGLFSDGGNMLSARYFHTVTRLTNGKVLITGGSDLNNTRNTAELYTPAP